MDNWRRIAHSHTLRRFEINTAGWEASYAACNRPDAIAIADREALCVAICHVLAALPENQRVRSFHALALPALDCFEKMTAIANKSVASDKSQAEIDSILSRVADEILIFTIMARTFTNACVANDSSANVGRFAVPTQHAAIPGPLLVIIRKGWPSLVHVSAMYSNDEVSVFSPSFLLLGAVGMTGTHSYVVTFE
jgi:hypothetical protein